MASCRDTYLDSEGLLESSSDVIQPGKSKGRRALKTGGFVAAGLLAVFGVLALHDSSIGTSSEDGIVELDSRNLLRKHAKTDKKTKKHGKAGETDEEEDPFAKCSWGKQNCNETKCCNNPGMKCYKQGDKTHYAQCKQTCVQGPDPTHWDGEWWSCEELGDRSEGNSDCSAMGEDCSKTQCCAEPNTQCFEKQPGWATCKTDCWPDSPDLNDVDGNHWTCKKLGPWNQGAAPWVAETCSNEGEDCTNTKCCAAPGMQCYQQNDDWAACKYDCAAGKDPDRDWEPAWSCKEIGMRTPGTGPPPPSTVGGWVRDTCGWANGDCSQSRCCVGMNQQCFAKNDDWAVCKESCTAGKNPFDNNETWSCKPLGPRSNGLPVKGSPPIFCWSLFQTTGYEMPIMQRQMETGGGIFTCDDYALLSTDPETVLGNDLEGREVKTKKVKNAAITTSVDGTAGNAELFINCWNVIVEDGRWNNHAWTVKVDPDAVVIASRLRSHLASHVMENVYVVNCNKFPSSPNFPMMYGSLEIYSWKAIQTYANKMSLCMEDMGSMLPLWGEDYFMTHCLDHIGVGRIEDFAAIGDDVCLGANCQDQWVAAFHPFKDVDSWQACWDTANR